MNLVFGETETLKQRMTKSGVLGISQLASDIGGLDFFDARENFIHKFRERVIVLYFLLAEN